MALNNALKSIDFKSIQTELNFKLCINCNDRNNDHYTIFIPIIINEDNHICLYTKIKNIKYYKPFKKSDLKISDLSKSITTAISKTAAINKKYKITINCNKKYDLEITTIPYYFNPRFIKTMSNKMISYDYK